MGPYKVLCIASVLWMGVEVSAVTFPTAPAATAAAVTVVTSADHVISPESDLDIASWLDRLFGIRLDADERRCAEQQKVLHRATNACFQLYHRGPCGRREWLVFDRAEASSSTQHSPRLVAVCKRRECAPSWGLDLRSNKCFRHAACPPPTAFQYTLFGDGRCVCNATAAAFAGTPSRRCQELFHDDVCPPGKILAPRYTLLGGMDAACAPDPCHTHEEQQRGSESQIVFTPRQQSDSPATRRPVAGFPGDVIHFGGNARAAAHVAVRAAMHSSLPVASLLQNQRRAAERRRAMEGEGDFDAAPPPPSRRDVARRGVRGEARVLNHLLLTTAPAAERRLNVLLPQSAPPPRDDVVPPPPTATPLPERLHVKYPDGTALCHSAAELNVTCDLQLKSLFSSSDLGGGVRVPLCVEKWFRFAVGRVGKSEECVSNDDGVCAAKVVVGSSDPFDWDFE